jgi:hypothetical protein
MDGSNAGSAWSAIHPVLGFGRGKSKYAAERVDRSENARKIGQIAAFTKKDAAPARGRGCGDWF